MLLCQILASAVNPLIRLNENKTENTITIKIKTGYLEVLKSETMKLLGRTKNKITKDKNGKNVSHLEITKAVLAHCDIVISDYQHDSRVLYTFAPNKTLCQIIDISPKNFAFLKTFDLYF